MERGQRIYQWEHETTLKEQGGAVFITVLELGEVEVLRNVTKTSDTQPDYRVVTQGIEVGAGWIKKGETSGKEYVSLALAAPDFRPKKLYANLGRAAGQPDDNLFALIWNPTD